MSIWLALLAAPSLALGCQLVLLALATPSCAAQTRLALHVVALGSLVLALLFTAFAFRAWNRRDHRAADADLADRASVRSFLAMSATAVGALSSLTILAMWVAVWVLSPCAS